MKAHEANDVASVLSWMEAIAVDRHADHEALVAAVRAGIAMIRSAPECLGATVATRFSVDDDTKSVYDAVFNVTR